MPGRAKGYTRTSALPVPLVPEENVHIDPLLSPDAFVGLDNTTHLCTGGEAPWLKDFAPLYDDFAHLKSGGYEGRQVVYEKGEACRQKMGRLWDVAADRVAFMPSAAEAMSWLARGLDWRAGDNVVVPNLEFPSVAYAWKQLEPLGVEIRLVAHQNWRTREEDLLAAADSCTRVIAVSQVSFYSGQNLDIARLSEGCHQRGILLAVDATHASGNVQVPAPLTDWCLSSSYKWMLATHGVAPCYASPRAEDQLRPTSLGWRNLDVWPAQGAERLPEVDTKPMPDRLEPGNPAMLVILFLNKALDVLLDIGIERIEAHNQGLSEYIAEGLQQLGLEVISPAEKKARSGNTCFAADDAKGLQERLGAEGVLVWGEYGRVRISGHLYNGSADAQRLFAVLKDLV